jgi:membrane associated rhomboid family serine protease
MDFEYLIQAPIALFFFLITIVTSLAGFRDQNIILKFIMWPNRMLGIDGGGRQYYRLLTSALIHADWMHLIFNMLTFYFFAFMLEIYYLGHVGFLILYVGGALFSSLPDLFNHRRDPQYMSLGASGAISAVVFSFILFNPTAMLGVFFFVPMPAWLFAILYLAFSYYAGRNQGAGMLSGNINHAAHLWGAIAGLGITLLIEPKSGLYFLYKLGLIGG